MNRAQKAVQMFNSNFNCAQSILAAFADELNLDQATALKLGSGFGGGIGCSGEVCGGVTGAAMALGLRYGTADPDDQAAKTAVYRKVRAFADEFKLRTGSLYCRDLMGFDMSTSEGQAVAAYPGAFERCDGFVRIAAELLEEML
ncbi:MAG: C-GCAxxG-C-C family protein [Planctomycetales bacterium]|nr:C-GCAxxG-C-C family protein [Planctomycetales bacterium]